MEGVRGTHTAKALAWVARQQRRWSGLIAYSGKSGERLLALPPGRWNEDIGHAATPTNPPDPDPERSDAMKPHESNGHTANARHDPSAENIDP
jgi:hypothetical protein